MSGFRTTVASLAVAAGLAVSAVSGAVAGPVLEPATQTFIDQRTAAGGTPLYKLTPAEARNVLLAAQSGPIAKPAVEIEDRTIPVGPKGETRIRIMRPLGAKETLPVIVYFHGAGWVMGDTATHDRLVRELTVGAHAALVFVDYSRSPENHYPVAIEEDYAATKFVADNAKALNVDASRLVVAGDSVGGNMVAVITLLAKERKGPNIKAQLLFYPVTSAAMDTPSYAEFANGPWLTKPAMEWFWNAYLPDAAKRADKTVSPLNATLEDLKGLPPALVITDENDVLRDEGEAYAHKLMQAGVHVTATRYLGTIHDFVLLNALAQTPATRGAMQQATDFIKAAQR